MRLNERFHQPENFDKVTDGKGWVMYAGGNDWENGCSACCVTRTGNEQLDRVWMTVKCCDGASKDADCSTKESEVFKEHGDKAWRMWEKVARRLHAKVEYTSASSWLDSFKEALTDPEMKPFVDEHGRERTKWSDVEEAAPRRAKALVQAPADLDDPEMILRQQPGFRFVNTSYMGTKVYLEDDPEEHKQDDWPLDIGRVIHGPDPKLVGAMTWYVIGIRGMNDDDLHAANLGTRDRPNLKTFATKEDAAMAIWLIWSRFDDKQKRGYRLPPGPLNRKHEGAAKAVATLLDAVDVAELCGQDDDPNNPEGDFQRRFKDVRDHHKDKVGFRYGQLNPGQHQLIYPQDKTIEPSTEPVIEPDVARLTQLGLNLGEALDEEPPLDARSEVDRLLPMKTYHLGGCGFGSAAAIIGIARQRYSERGMLAKRNGLDIMKSWPIPDEVCMAILKGKCDIEVVGEGVTVRIKQY